MKRSNNNLYPYSLIKGLGTGLGYTATSKRKLQSGVAYDKFFPKPINTDPFLNQDGTVYDTIEYCGKISRYAQKDTHIISNLLKRDKLNDTCKAIFDFCYKHIQYRIDEPGIEQLRRPARAWQDRKTGIDCDCYSILISSILLNMNCPHYLRMVKMYGRDYYQHIYVIVPKFKGADVSKRNNYYVIDPVLDTYDKEAPEINETKDKYMSIQGLPIQFLNGVGDTRLGDEFNGLGDGLGDTDHKRLHSDFMRRCKMHLVNTRNHIARHPRQIGHIYNVQGLLGAYDQLIGAWDNENTRAATLDHLSGIEESLLQPSLQGLGDIIHGNDSELFGLIDADLSGIGSLEGKKRKARHAATGTHTRRKKTGVFTKLKNANHAAKGKKKGFFKKLGTAILKFNPVSLAIRGGFLVAMKMNVLRIASRLYWALFTEAEAVAAGVSRAFYRKAVKGLEFIKKLFETKLKGTFKALRKAIISGRAAKVAKKLAQKGKLNGLDELSGTSGLGVVAAASVGAAMTFLTAVAGFLSKVMGKTGNSGKEEAEAGGETEATNANAPGALTQTDAGPVVDNGHAEAMYNSQVNQSGGGEPAASSDNGDGKGAADDESDHASNARQAAPQAASQSETTQDPEKSNTETTSAETKSTPAKQQENADNEEQKPKKSNGAGIIAAVGLAAIAVAVIGSKKKDKSKAIEQVAGLDPPAKRKQAIKKVTLT